MLCSCPPIFYLRLTLKKLKPLLDFYDEIQFSHLRYLINLHTEWTLFRECNNLLSFEVNKDSGISVLRFRKSLWKFYVIKHPVADAPQACSSLHSCRTALFLHTVSVHPLSVLCRLSHIAASDKMWSLLHADKEKIQILYLQLWAMDTAGAPEMDIKHVGNHLPHEDQQHQPPAQLDSLQWCFAAFKAVLHNWEGTPCNLLWV